MKPAIIRRLLTATLAALPAAIFAADTDSDGLDDSVETNTGVYVSTANTGTNPAVADSDGDGAGDWYEVAIIDVNPANPQPNTPNSAAIKPNIPYPLPAPDATPPATNKPVKVFILSGQSNMVGQGNITPLGTAGTLETITRTEKKFPNLLNGASWSVRNDVRYRGVIAATGNAPLTAGQGGSTTTIGPELGFGHVMGYYHDEPVLILKSSEGGRALGWDFLPPGSVPYAVGGTTYAGYGDSPASWATGTTPVPTAFYGGYQFDQCFLRKADWAPAGAANAATTNVTTVLDNFAADYPQWADQGFEIAGFAWFHGWNDGLSYTKFYADRYEINMAQFIRQIRAYYESRYPGKVKPKAPFVIATAAFEGWNEAYLNQYPTRRTVINAQFAVSDPVKYPEFAGNVKTMEARGYWRDKAISPIPSGNQGYHYNRNAETFMLVGDALGRGMIDLVSSATPDTTPPAISGTNPAANSTGVGTSANLVLTFNESVALGTGNVTVKNVTDGTQSSIAVTDATQVSLLGAVLTINPTANLAEGKSYALQIDATAIKDLADNPFAGIADDTTWSFVTAAPDTTAPTPNPMTWATPPTAASGTSITMTATTASDPGGVQYFFDCTTAGGHDSAWQDSPTYTDTGLLPATSHTYQVKARDKSPANNETASSSAQSATTTAPDTTAPSVSTYSPATNATGVALATHLVLTFNEAIALGTGNITLENLTDGTQATIAITDAAQVAISGAVLTINPTANLAGSKSYAIRIDATAIKDLSNNPFAGIADDTTWNFTTTTPPASADILIVNQVEGFLGKDRTQVTTAHDGTGLLSYNATGVEKLVVAIGTESGFNNNSATVTGVKFNGVALTQAVQENTIFDTTPPLPGDFDGGTAAIFYLDNPFQGAATFTVSATTSAGTLNGGWVSIIGLAGTAPGVGNTGKSWFTQAAAGNVSTSLATSAGNSLVVAMVENSGRNKGAGNPDPTVVSPLTLSNNGYWGSQYGSGASGYQKVPTSGTTITPTFTTNAGGNIHVVAAEFLALQLPTDTTPPTLVSIVDDKSGGPVAVNTPVTYTVTFSEDMDAGTVTADDFGNAGDATITIGTVVETTPGVFTVPVTPTTAGTLQLRVNQAAELKDVASNALVTTSAISDDTTLTVNGTLPTLTSIVDDKSGGPVMVNSLVTYTVTFSGDMDETTVAAADFGNAGDATFTIGTVAETAPGIFTVPVTPTSVGTLQLQIIAGAVLKDGAGNALNTAAAIADDTTLTVMIATSNLAIDAVYFGQTHLWKPDHPYFGLVGERDCLIKAHVTDPAMIASPAVTAVLSLNGQTLNLPLSGPATLPAAIPDGLGVVQHSLSDTFTATIPAAWVKTGLQVTVTAGAASVGFTDLKVGAPTKVVMTMLDVNYFTPTSGDYPAGWQAELEAKWPVADLALRRIPNIVFRELVIPPRSDVGAQAAKVKSPGDYTLQTGLGFDGEQAAALAWNGALKRAAGRSGRISLYYMNIYGANAGGQAGGFAGVGNGTSVGILHHELGHSLSLPHWGDAVYPYKGDMYGILAPDSYNGTHAGPVWGYDPRLPAFIPPTVQPGNVGNHPLGTYKVDPMQGGGTGWQEPGFLMNHFSDYSAFKMREYLHGHVLIWNEALNSYASWNQAAGAYTSTVSNNGVQYPLERDAQVISVMASISGAKPSVNMVYPPIGPYTAGLIRLFDPRVPADRSAATSTGYAPAGGCDVSLRVIQSGVEKIYMLAAPWEPTADLLASGSLKTEAINLPATDGSVTLAELLYTPDAQINGLPADPQVLATWAPVMPDPAGFAVPPVAGNSSVISMTATTGTSELGPVEYLFTETSGKPGGSSSGWQTNPAFTDTGLEPSTTYSYTVTLRAGAVIGRASAAAMATTAVAGLPGTITFDGFVTDNTGGAPKTFTFDASASDKLVVVVTGEHNNPGSTAGDVVSITYDGVLLTKAVEQSPVSPTFQTTSDLWYLDHPGSVHTAGQIVVVMVGNGNNFVHTAIGLSGTADGFAGASAIAVGSPTVSMNVSAANSLVLSWLTLGGSGSTAGSAYTVTANAPVGATTFGGSEAGGNYAGHVLARSSGLPVGSNTFSFDTGLTDVITLAAEFLAADLPAPPYAVWAAGPFASTLTNPAAPLDFDHGGLPTGIEWVVGGDPTTGSDDTGLAPTLDTTSDPTGKFLFTYRRSDAAKLDPDTTIAVEYGDNLTTWATATHQGTGASDISISEVPDGPGFAKVTVAIPRSVTPGDKLFARLRVVVATP